MKSYEVLLNTILVPLFLYLHPGSILAHFYYLEAGGATGACKACWDYDQGSHCWDSTLDGILTIGTRLPTGAWWDIKN